MAVDLLSTEVVAVVTALAGDEPQVLTAGSATGVPALPAGPLLADHRSLQAGLRDWVEALTGLHLGYVEQLYTFADRERVGAHTRVISVSYLGLTRPGHVDEDRGTWRGWYELFPWEDRRTTTTDALLAELRERLAAWATAATGTHARADRAARVRVAFGSPTGEADGPEAAPGTAPRAWHPEDCLARYELLWEAGLLPESPRPDADAAALIAQVGPRMRHDHRRIVATAMARLRGKIQYRPVVFELLPEEFTLGRLQAVVEALSGTRVHKQNFRRLVEHEDLVEETGGRTRETGGRPAKLVRFRADVVSERPATGVRLPNRR